MHTLTMLAQRLYLLYVVALLTALAQVRLGAEWRSPPLRRKRGRWEVPESYDAGGDADDDRHAAPCAECSSAYRTYSPDATYSTASNSL